MRKEKEDVVNRGSWSKKEWVRLHWGKKRLEMSLSSGSMGQSRSRIWGGFYFLKYQQLRGKNKRLPVNPKRRKKKGKSEQAYRIRQ